MVKTVIKSDGRKEPFIQSKIDGWGEFAAKNLSIDWMSIVESALDGLPEECSSRKIQDSLIKQCLYKDNWRHHLMAGRLYAALIYKDVFGSKDIPTVKEVHDKAHADGLMRKLNFTDKEYAEFEKVIKHDRDKDVPHYCLDYMKSKYALQNRVTKKVYESQQFTYARMAMALADSQHSKRKMKDAKTFYDLFSRKILSSPTPNYINLGTYLNGYASCAAYLSGDSIPSLAAGDHIAYILTAHAHGIGSKQMTRSMGDEIRKGAVKHNGKVPYFRNTQGNVKANKQGGRGGAATAFWEVYDPEALSIIPLKNPMSTEDNRVDGIDYAMQSNDFFAKKVAKNEDIFQFNIYTAPDLVAAIYKGDQSEFESLYAKYEADDSFKKKYISARELLILWMTEAFETGKAYEMYTDEMNRHTPHKDEIYSSNLCLELAQPTKAYESIADLYLAEDHGRGEVTVCSLAAINVARCKTDKEYEQACYYALLMIDKCIHMSDYPLPHVGFTAKQRLNAGVGVMGVAELMAEECLLYSTEEGKRRLHEIYERHAYFCIKASLRLGKELGNAPWMHKTKWPEGWLPIDTYNRNVDGIVKGGFTNNYDWEGLRSDIIANGGIRNSSVINHMPGESSSKALVTTNSGYPVRDLTLNKTDGDTSIYWSAPNGDNHSYFYEMAWDIDHNDIVDGYAIQQKWTDQSISADLWEKVLPSTMISTTKIISDYLYRKKMGMKTRYYNNTLTSSQEYCENCSV